MNNFVHINLIIAINIISKLNGIQANKVKKRRILRKSSFCDILNTFRSLSQRLGNLAGGGSSSVYHFEKSTFCFIDFGYFRHFYQY